jgi:hypothetical protein
MRELAARFLVAYMQNSKEEPLMKLVNNFITAAEALQAFLNYPQQQSKITVQSSKFGVQDANF